MPQMLQRVLPIIFVVVASGTAGAIIAVLWANPSKDCEIDIKARCIAGFILLIWFVVFFGLLSIVQILAGHLS